MRLTRPVTVQIDVLLQQSSVNAVNSFAKASNPRRERGCNSCRCHRVSQSFYLHDPGGNLIEIVHY